MIDISNEIMRKCANMDTQLLSIIIRSTYINSKQITDSENEIDGTLQNTWKKITNYVSKLCEEERLQDLIDDN